MKKIVFTIGFLFVLSFAVFAQIENPVTWNYTVTKLADKKFEVHIVASIEPGWHLYAQDAGDGPEPTSISFTKNPLVKTNGKTKELGKLKKEYDPNFESELKFYESKVDFVQEISVRSTASTVVKGNVKYMVCNDKKCLPPKSIPFSVKVSGK